MKIGDKIKKLRELKNLTQQHIADKLELSLSGYGKIERNETDVTISKLEKIAAILEVSLIDLLKFNDDIFFSSEKKKINFTIGEQFTFQSEIFDKLSKQYTEEIKYLRALVNELTNKLNS